MPEQPRSSPAVADVAFHHFRLAAPSSRHGLLGRFCSPLPAPLMGRDVPELQQPPPAAASPVTAWHRPCLRAGESCWLPRSRCQPGCGGAERASKPPCPQQGGNKSRGEASASSHGARELLGHLPRGREGQGTWLDLPRAPRRLGGRGAPRPARGEGSQACPRPLRDAVLDAGRVNHRPPPGAPPCALGAACSSCPGPPFPGRERGGVTVWR